MAEKRRGLGRGIGALIPTAPPGGKRPSRASDIFFEGNPGEEEPSSAQVIDPIETTPSVSPTADPGPVLGGSAGASSSDEALEASREASVAEPVAPSAGIGAAPHATVDAAETAGSAAPPSSRRPASVPESTPTEVDGLMDEGLRPVPGATYAEVPVGSIVANARQPRQVFDEDDLDELAASIRELGVLQPVVVRPLAEDDPRLDDVVRYELVMGERRLRASRQAALEAIPAVIRETDDTDLLRDALLENLHRAQLNPLEEAAAYQQLLDDFGGTHDELARRIARSRPQISNTLRLLKLPALVQRRVAAGVLSAGHARALLGLEDGAAMERLAQRIVAEGLSVRATEEAVAMGEGPSRPELRRRRAPAAHAEQFDRLATRLSDRLDTRVKVAMGQRKGRLTVDFASVEDLDRILATLVPGEQVADE